MNKTLAKHLAVVIDASFTRFKDMEESKDLNTDAWYRMFKGDAYPYINDILNYITKNDVNVHTEVNAASIADVLEKHYISSDSRFIEKECENINAAIDKELEELPKRIIELEESYDRWKKKMKEYNKLIKS